MHPFVLALLASICFLHYMHQFIHCIS